MDDLGLDSYLKTTGGKGLHVVVPFKRRYEWDVIKSFARAFAERMASETPERYVSNMSKAKRKGKIFLDYLRNDITSTAVAPYSARARENATVAMPLSWHELDMKLDPRKYTIETIPGILSKRKKDPWLGLLQNKQSLSSAILKKLGISV
jgi:bifunctional non-homologous end joining protein LigD